MHAGCVAGGNARIGSGCHRSGESHIRRRETRRDVGPRLQRRKIFSFCSFFRVSDMMSVCLPTRRLASFTDAAWLHGMKSSFQPDDLMAILDGIDDAVVKLDGQARFAAMNQAAASIFERLGLNFFQNMKAKSVWDVFPELKGTHVERELRHVIDDHVQVGFEFCYSRDQHWYEMKGYPASPGAILVFRDITAKKHSSGQSTPPLT